MDLDVLALSRAQFALTIMFHYLFPPLSIGLGLLLVLAEGIYLRTGDRHYESLARFFTKLYAVNFAIGVATGIVMEFQFGTNWATYSRFVGDVFGSALAAEGMPAGYRFEPDPNVVAASVMGASTWAVLALTCHIELFTQAHYRASIAPDEGLSALYKDVFLFHWKEESQHALLDELEWERENDRISLAERDRAVDDLIALVGAVDGILQVQSRADASYFVGTSDRVLTQQQADVVVQALGHKAAVVQAGEGVRERRLF